MAPPAVSTTSQVTVLSVVPLTALAKGTVPCGATWAVRGWTSTVTFELAEGALVEAPPQADSPATRETTQAMDPIRRVILLGPFMLRTSQS